MCRHQIAIFISAMSVFIALPREAVLAQSPAQLTTGTLTHLTVVTADLDATARTYADLFGISLPQIRNQTIDLPDGSKVEVRAASVPLPNFRIDLNQPVTKSGPVYEHLQKYGLTVYRLGVSSTDNVDDIRGDLVKKGGKWTAGAPGGSYAFVDLRDRIGVTLEITRSAAATTATTPPAAPPQQTGLLGGLPVNHIGLAVRNVEETMNAFVEILGVKAVPVNEFPNPPAPFQFPLGSKWDVNAHVRTNMLRYGRVALELIQSVGGPTPWTETLEKQKGLGIQHMAVGRGTLSREEWLRLGQSKGGKWTNGGPPPQGTFAYLDFSETTGLIFE
jgi:catechol 2,3-dioxygenase-like lactoylglutathione lyase family enzyme